MESAVKKTYESVAQQQAAQIDYGALYPDAQDGLDQDTTELGTIIFFRSLKASWIRHKMLLTGFILLMLTLSIGLGTIITVSWGGVVFLLLAGVLITWALIIHTRAQDDFWSQWAQHRGLVLGEDIHDFDSSVPLLREGDERKMERVCTGRIGSVDGRIFMYTYTKVVYDGEGRRSETHFPFSVVAMRLPQSVAKRYPGVDLKRALTGLDTGKLLDGFSPDRGIKLESMDFNTRYRLRVLDEQDDIALYELFSTPFIQYLVEEGEINWQQRGDEMVIYWENHTSDPDLLDVYVQRAVTVHKRYLEEYQ